MSGWVNEPEKKLSVLRHRVPLAQRSGQGPRGGKYSFCRASIDERRTVLTLHNHTVRQMTALEAHVQLCAGGRGAVVVCLVNG